MLIRYNDTIIDVGEMEITPAEQGGRVYFTPPAISALVDTDIERVMVCRDDDVLWHRAIVRADGSLLVDMTSIREWSND